MADIVFHPPPPSGPPLSTGPKPSQARAPLTPTKSATDHEGFEYWELLPDLVKDQVLAELSLKDRLLVQSVCRDFQRRLRRPGLWKNTHTLRLFGNRLSTNRDLVGIFLITANHPGSSERRTKGTVGLLYWLASCGVALRALELWTPVSLDPITAALTSTGTRLTRLVLEPYLSRPNGDYTAPVRRLLASQCAAGRLEQLALCGPSGPIYSCLFYS